MAMVSLSSAKPPPITGSITAMTFQRTWSVGASITRFGWKVYGEGNGDESWSNEHSKSVNSYCYDYKERPRRGANHPGHDQLVKGVDNEF